MKYIATRPRAERIGIHGLFGDEETVSLGKAMEELENYTGNVWTHIISLKREDAVRGRGQPTVCRHLRTVPPASRQAAPVQTHSHCWP